MIDTDEIMKIGSFQLEFLLLTYTPCTTLTLAIHYTTLTLVMPTRNLLFIARETFQMLSCWSCIFVLSLSIELVMKCWSIAMLLND
jgi:hypothetical protein